MAENHRLLETDRAEAAVLVVMQVGAADAACREADFDLTRSWCIRPGHFFNPQIERSVNDD